MSTIQGLLNTPNLVRLPRASESSGLGTVPRAGMDFLNQLQQTPPVGAAAPTTAEALDPTKTLASPPWTLADLPGMGNPRGIALEQRPTAWPLQEQDLASGELKSLPTSAQQAMQQFVGETFYGMLLKQMRNTVMESDLLGNSSAKKMFQSQLDQTLVQELAIHHSEFLSHPIRI